LPRSSQTPASNTVLEVAGLPSVEELEAELRMRRLVDFVPAVSPQYMAPHHLAPLLERFEAAVDGRPQRVCCSAPPRHGKTEAVLHVPAFALRRRPELTFSYSTYADRLSRSKSRKARLLAQQAGVELASTSLNEWRTPQGGGLLAGGVGGPLTGHGVNILLVDDPIKSRLEAESQTYRERLVDWWRDVAATRIEPGGSAFVFMTRWHPDDLVGVLVSEGFEYINLPAISEDGAALWPERWPVEALERRRDEVGDYTWASLYQGTPRTRGGRVFGDACTYDAPPTVYRAAVGLDVAYSARTASDYTVAVRMLRQGDRYFVADVMRWQLQPTQAAPRLAAWAKARPGEVWRWYASGTETGTAQFLRQSVPMLQAVTPSGDKFVRAIGYAAAWNQGRVLLPQSAPWLDVFVAEHAGFTGINDAHDDIIDACVAAFDVLSLEATSAPAELVEAEETSALRMVAM